MSCMARIVDYAVTLQTMEKQGFKSLYYNSGAFGFADMRGVTHVGWMTGEDWTLREEMRMLARPVQRLGELARRAWQEYLPGVVWVMPMSHWAYELDFGSQEWMPAALREVGVEPGMLEGRTTGNAIEFEMEEGPAFQGWIEQLLARLKTSDFMLAFPGRPMVCTIHHHHQLWWTGIDGNVLNGLRSIMPAAL
jgi:hypothetical protein